MLQAMDACRNQIGEEEITSATSAEAFRDLIVLRGIGTSGFRVTCRVTQAWRSVELPLPLSVIEARLASSFGLVRDGCSPGNAKGPRTVDIKYNMSSDLSSPTLHLLQVKPDRRTGLLPGLGTAFGSRDKGFLGQWEHAWRELHQA